MEEDTLQISCENENPKTPEYLPGDPIWVKNKSHGWWPARVVL